VAAWTLAAVSFGVSLASAQTESTPLSAKHRKWREEEAVHLITDQEEKVFEKLSTDEERERFIAAFWEARDPTPGTSRNEFRERYQERIKEANRLFRGHGAPGWRTEQGRIYILLGPPKERRSFDHIGELWPVSLWFYQTDDPALPPFFYLLFYRKGGTGPYRLWQPINEGPAALLAVPSSDITHYDRQRVYAMFQRWDADLHQAVVAPVPGQSSASAQFDYQQILGVLEDYPNRSLNPAIGGRYQPGRGIVETDFVFRKLDVSPLVALLPSDNGVFLHYALEAAPEQLSYAQFEKTFYTVFDLEVQLETREGQAVYQIQHRREIEVPEASWNDVRQRPLSLQGRFPVIPGEFRLRVLIRSRTGRVFDTVETELGVLEAVDASQLLPASFFQSRDTFEGQVAFQIQDALVVPHPRANYQAGGKLRAFLVLAPSEEQEPVEIRGQIVRGEEVIHTLTQQFQRQEGNEPALVGFELSLGAELAPGDYALKVELGSGQERFLPFAVEGPSLVPPLVNSEPEAPTTDGKWNVERARQHLALGQNAEALESLAEAVRRSPDLDSARMQLAVLAVGVGKPDLALEAVVPALMRAPFHYDFLALAGYASELLGRLDDAARYYERAREASKPDDKLLRALASVYDRLGEKEKAEAVRKQISG
jgi:GWxTD domain-containing protein